MISRHNIVAVAAAAVLGAAALPATAQQSPPSGATPQQAQPQRPYANQLMTQEERDAFRKQMQDAQTPEARTKIRDTHRAEMQKRAAAQGLTLQGRSGQPRMYGSDLMTPQERDAYIEKLRSAKTQDERLKLRDAHRAEMQKRAKDTGVTLPEPRDPGAGKGPGGAAKGGRGQMYGQEFFTPDERKAYFDRMQAATTPEERAKIRDELRATAQARAKEKGVTLPEPGARGPGGPGPGPGPAPGAPKAQ
jgi:hypothetical protein